MFKTDYLAISIGCFSEVNRQLYYELAKLGKKVVIVFPEQLPFPEGMRTYEKIVNNTIVSIPSKTKFKNPRLTQYNGLKKIIEQYRPEYIYTEYDPASLLAVVLGRWSKKFQFKLLCNSCENMELDLQSVYQREGFRGLAPCLMKNLFIKLTKKNIYHIFALGQDGKRIFQNLGYKSVSIIHLGFDEDLFKPNPAKREEIRKELGLHKIVVGYFGRTVPEKGVHILIEALAKLKHLDWQFLMDEFSIYKTPYQQSLVELIHKNGIGDRVVYFDAPHETVAWYMNAADIAVVHSLSSKKWKEQFGRVAPETMACGLAVLVSSSGTLKELVPNESFIIEEKNSTALAHKLEELITHPDLIKEMGTLAQQHAHQKYTMVKQAEIIASIR
jgi:glycosyltransferase involved in cell wall biosynthesis